jgi:hypothetical protein
MKTNNISKDALVGIVSLVNPALSVSLGISWEVAKSIINESYENEAIKSRLIEVLKFIGENKTIIENDILKNNPHTISGLIILYENIVKQRFEWKRERIFGIFLGFLNQNDKENFELEKMYNILNLMSLTDLQTLHLFETNGRINFHRGDVQGPLDEKNINELLSLLALGIIKPFNYNEWNPTPELSDFGRQLRLNLFDDN